MSGLLETPLFYNYTRADADQAIAFLLRHNLIRTNQPLVTDYVLHVYYGHTIFPVREAGNFVEDGWFDKTMFHQTPPPSNTQNGVRVAESTLTIESGIEEDGNQNAEYRTETKFRYDQDSYQMIEFEHISYQKIDEPRTVICRMPVFMM